MLKLFSKNKNKNVKTKGFYSIMDGKSIDLSQVNDEMFSNKLLGDGIAIEPTSNTVVSPCDGEVTLVSDTKHAVGIKNEDGVEILIHIGLDTVNLKGEGFETFCKVGDKVKVGDTLVKVDRKLLKEKNIPDVTMMVIVEPNGHTISERNINQSVECGTSLLVKYE
ncbi:PTS sugar transporter subunit IIA [Romboutsia sp. Marseille-P6047]|uniref:PTS sugar transporter subunit IIA n=1 Tax=Romboutsia sp. Marseille-P6047 TaxID=2161817 RepID=UPI000822EC8E|nr:PTS glucose transporter subunit IIA [Romboutsia sp. Marseille-P6047]SCH87554.1 EIICBA-Glc 2 [uncultured Clostridium sp.]